MGKLRLSSLNHVPMARSGKKKVPVWSEDRDSEGAERSGVWGGGIPLPSRLVGLGERRELPQRPKTILVRSEGARTALVAMHATEIALAIKFNSNSRYFLCN